MNVGQAVRSGVAVIAFACIIAGSSQGTAIAIGSSAGPGAAGSKPSLERSRAVILSYIDAYNRQDTNGVLALMDFHYVGRGGESFHYFDCNFRTRTLKILTTKKHLRAWLQRRFSLHDHFELVSVQQLPRYPQVVGFTARRSSDDLRAKGWSPLEMATKFVMDGTGDRTMRNAVGDCRNLPPL